MVAAFYRRTDNPLPLLLDVLFDKLPQQAAENPNAEMLLVQEKSPAACSRKWREGSRDFDEGAGSEKLAGFGIADDQADEVHT